MRPRRDGSTPRLLVISARSPMAAGVMAKLHFYYASMNAGKSTMLLQAAFNYRERGLATMLWTAAIDQRPGGEAGTIPPDAVAIRSRIGLEARAHGFDADTDLWARTLSAAQSGAIACVLVDEAQFLTSAQVWQLARLVDRADIPVVCYGLRTDFLGNLFDGSAALLGIADRLVEITGVCHCGRKATMNLRIDARGNAVTSGDQTEIGGNDRYLALCRRHFREALGQ